ncbi:MAG: beta-1,6-N-acetylglucosaminyltransferase [Lachnospiraceae bacterium]|nr:beta-1,6-N-acetylglucosaminyltransferase [Lachnospiraceae bacterium]
MEEKCEIKKKHAFLILAHQNPEQLERLVSRLDSSVSNIYIHIDKKSHEMRSSDIVKRLSEKSNVILVPSIKTYWGGFSLVQAELILLREAYKDETNGYFHLLSGADYPTKPIETIVKRFENDTHDYIMWDEAESDRRYLIDSFYFYDLYNGRSKVGFWNDRVKRPFLVFIQRISHFCVSVLHLQIRRQIPGKYYHAYCAQWFSITKDTVGYILDYLSENPWYEQRFKHTAVSDETFLQMIIMNGPRAKYAVNNNLRYFGDGHMPQDQLGVDMKDYDSIINGDYIFVRKVLPNYSDSLIGKLEE